MLDDKKISIHRMPQDIVKHQIHQQYGLWLISGGSSSPGGPKNSFPGCAPRTFEFYSISHMFEGHGKLWLAPGVEQEVKAGECIVITPGTINRYGGHNDVYQEDNLTFCGPVADMLMQAGVISNGVFPLGKERRLLPIQAYMLDPTVNSQIKANIELQRLLVDIYLEKCSSEREEYPQFEKLLRRIRENPQQWWTVSDMADQCNLSRDQFRRVFHQRTGINPKLFIDRSKLNKAAEMLINTRNSIAEIAARFGYEDQYHFSRRFKSIFGISPSRYRETMNPNNK